MQFKTERLRRKGNRLIKTILWTITVCLLFIQPAAAQSNESSENGLDYINFPCKPPEGLMPLFELLDTLIELSLLAGVGLGVLGLVVAGIMYAAPGDDLTQKAKKVAKSTVVGTVLLLSAPFIIDFFVSQIGVGC